MTYQVTDKHRKPLAAAKECTPEFARALARHLARPNEPVHIEGHYDGAWRIIETVTASL